jgi:hypothetical protein
MRVGFGRFPSPGAPNVTPGLMDATRRFQTAFGLKPDAVIHPGGPPFGAAFFVFAPPDQNTVNFYI